MKTELKYIMSGLLVVVSFSTTISWTAAQGAKVSLLSVIGDSRETKTIDKALIEALRNRNIYSARAFLQAGANPNARSDYYAHTALMLAVENNAEVVELLLKYGADVNARAIWGYTALIKAAEISRNPKMVKLLLDHRADINAKKDNGDTALSGAISCGDAGSVTLLLECRVDCTNVKFCGTAYTPASTLARTIRDSLVTIFPQFCGDKKQMAGRDAVIQILEEHEADLKRRSATVAPSFSSSSLPSSLVSDPITTKIDSRTI
jgi:ankyrin repeat protein